MTQISRMTQIKLLVSLGRFASFVIPKSAQRFKMRDQNYLEGRLNSIWQSYFNDFERENVCIRWGRRARTRLGSITRARFGKSIYSYAALGEEGSPIIITINRLFTNEEIPEFVIDATIAHEICHYVHGFSTGSPKYAYPHLGGVVTLEMRQRGLAEILKMQKKWLKENWRGIIQAEFPRRIRRHRVYRWFWS